MAFVPVQSASALTIVRNFAGGTAPVTVAGGGNLVNIFNTAADWWELAILDAHTVTIGFSWAPLAVLGVHNLVTQGGTPNRETAATIRFDNDGTSSWFLDPTPDDNSEWLTFTETEANLGGGLIDTGRFYSGATGNAVGNSDMLTVALHEIGHSLGLSAANTSFTAENVDLDIDITSGPNAGTVIPTISGAHLNVGSGALGALLFPNIFIGVRKEMSAVDILANCQISQFTNCNLDPVMVPEPATLALFGMGLAGLGFMRRRRAI